MIHLSTTYIGHRNVCHLWYTYTHTCGVKSKHCYGSFIHLSSTCDMHLPYIQNTTIYYIYLRYPKGFPRFINPFTSTIPPTNIVASNGLEDRVEILLGGVVIPKKKIFTTFYHLMKSSIAISRCSRFTFLLIPPHLEVSGNRGTFDI